MKYGLLVAFISFSIFSTVSRAQNCEGLFEPSKTPFQIILGRWQKALENPVRRAALDEARSYGLYDALKVQSDLELVTLLAQPENVRLEAELNSRLERLEGYAEILRENLKNRGEVLGPFQLHPTESFLIEMFTQRNLQPVQRNPKDFEIALRGKKKLFKDLEPLSVKSIIGEPVTSEAELLKLRQKLELSPEPVTSETKEKESLWEKMKKCRAQETPSSEKKNFARSLSVALGMTATLTTTGHVSADGGIQNVKISELGTDLMVGMLSGTLNQTIMRNKGASLKMRWKRVLMTSGMRIPLDATIFYLDPFESPEKKTLRDPNDHLERTKHRVIFNTFWALLMDGKNVTLNEFLMGLRCLSRLPGSGLPGRVADEIQILDRLVFSVVYFNGRNYYLDAIGLHPVH